LKPESQDLFSIREEMEIKFERDSKNQITGFEINAGRVTNLKFSRK
jgi:hypothetical protein